MQLTTVAPLVSKVAFCFALKAVFFVSIQGFAKLYEGYR